MICRALLRSEKLLTLKVSAQREMLSDACAQFWESLTLTLAINKQCVVLNLALIFKIYIQSIKETEIQRNVKEKLIGVSYYNFLKTE